MIWYLHKEGVFNSIIVFNIFLLNLLRTAYALLVYTLYIGSAAQVAAAPAAPAI